MVEKNPLREIQRQRDYHGNKLPEVVSPFPLVKTGDQELLDNIGRRERRAQKRLISKVTEGLK